MPLSVNVGLSRKASKDYQSTGVSINVTAELDQSLLARPDELQKQIGDLYAQAQDAMERQATTMGGSAPHHDHAPRSNGRYDGKGDDPSLRNGNGQANARPSSIAMTQSQRRAIIVIADRVGVDPAQESRDVIGAELDALSIGEASELIDHLKAMQRPGNGGNGR